MNKKIIPKNQHYVPRFYLRNFSSNGKSISKFLINQNKFVKVSSIDKESSEKWFYGKDDEVEKLLSSMESESKKIIDLIIDKKKFPQNSKLRLPIYNFVMYQDRRTLKSKIISDELFDKATKIFLEFNGFSAGELASIKLENKNTMRNQVIDAFLFATVIMDLDLKLIINDTNVKFLTSDHPVIKQNYFLERMNKPLSIIGYALQGLEIILPISPSLAIILYDKNIYKIGHRNNKSLVVDNIQDIQNINKLTLLNANSTIYFSEGDENALNFINDHIKARKLLPDEKVEINSLKSETYNGQLVIQSFTSINSRIKLDFVKLQKNKKRITLIDYRNEGEYLRSSTDVSFLEKFKVMKNISKKVMLEEYVDFVEAKLK